MKKTNHVDFEQFNGVNEIFFFFFTLNSKETCILKFLTKFKLCMNKILLTLNKNGLFMRCNRNSNVALKGSENQSTKESYRKK